MDKSYFSSTENLNLNVYEDNPNTCEGVDPKSSTDCYFSEEVKPVMDVSPLLMVGFIKVNFTQGYLLLNIIQYLVSV